VFELSEEQARTILSSNCFYCGTEPSQIKNGKRSFGSFIYNGIDRLENSIGYVPSNVVPCCVVCNMAKSSLAFGSFVLWVMKTAAHLKKTRAEWGDNVKDLFDKTNYIDTRHPISRTIAQGATVKSANRRIFTRKTLENAAKLHTIESAALFLKTDPLTAKSKLASVGLSISKDKTFVEKTSPVKLWKAYNLAKKRGLQTAANFMKCSRDTICFAFKAAGLPKLQSGTRPKKILKSLLKKASLQPNATKAAKILGSGNASKARAKLEASGFTAPPKRVILADRIDKVLFTRLSNDYIARRINLQDAAVALGVSQWSARSLFLKNGVRIASKGSRTTSGRSKYRRSNSASGPHLERTEAVLPGRRP
jgi:hypothetical protein